MNPNPSGIRTQFPTLLPDQFTSDDTVLLQAPFNNNFSVLGVLNFDRQAGTFELFGLNQLGVVFFHVGGDRNGVAIREAIPPLMAHKDILLAMARDIQRIYFDLAPDGSSDVDVTPNEVIFNHQASAGTITYRFGYEPSLLLEKQLGGCFGAKWRVRYYDYRAGEGGKLFPRGIVMDNFQYHYRIIVKNRDWSVSGQ